MCNAILCTLYAKYISPGWMEMETVITEDHWHWETMVIKHFPMAWEGDGLAMQEIEQDVAWKCSAHHTRAEAIVIRSPFPLMVLWGAALGSPKQTNNHDGVRRRRFGYLTPQLWVSEYSVKWFWSVGPYGWDFKQRMYILHTQYDKEEDIVIYFICAYIIICYEVIPPSLRAWGISVQPTCMIMIRISTSEDGKTSWEHAKNNVEVALMDAQNSCISDTAHMLMTQNPMTKDHRKKS